MNPNYYSIGNSFTKKSLFSSVNWSSLLDGTQKTLSVINQAIPIFYQIKPVVNNARTMFKIAGELSKVDTATKSVNDSVKKNVNQPFFYI